MDTCYECAVFCFMAYITGYKTREDVKVLDEAFLRVGSATFIEEFVKEFRFKDEANALAFGAYMKEQYLLKNKEAFKGMPKPFKRILLEVLDAYDDDKTVILEDDGDDEVHASVIEGKK